jgi:polar amino acid transport system substrate-binding protein
MFADETSNYVIGFKKGDPNADTLRDEINKALSILKQNGILKSIYQAWGLWDDNQKDVGLTDTTKYCS